MDESNNVFYATDIKGEFHPQIHQLYTSVWDTQYIIMIKHRNLLSFCMHLQQQPCTF